MSMEQSNQSRHSALLRILQVTSTKSAKVITYAAAVLGMAALIPGLQLPPELSAIAAGIGVEAIGNLLDHIASGDHISDDEIRKQVERVIAQSGIDKLLTKEDFDQAVTQLKEGQQAIGSQNEAILKLLVNIGGTSLEEAPKPSPKEAAKRVQVIPYSLLPYEQQKDKLLQDLRRIVDEAHGTINMSSKWPSPTHVVLPVRGDPYVLRLILLRKCTLKMEMWQHIHTAWDYEHGILVIALGSVANRAFPPVYPRAMPQHSPTGWGWFTMFNLPTAQAFIPTLQAPLPQNTTDMSFVCFTLPQVQDSRILARKFKGMLDFLQTSDDNYARVQMARNSVNANLERWLSEGWLFPHEKNTWYIGRDEPPRKLKKNERFINGRIYVFKRPQLWADRAKQVMDSQKILPAS